MLNTSSIWCLPLQQHSLVVTCQEEGLRAARLPGVVTGLLMPVYDCLWNDARGRNQDPITFVSSSPTPDCSWLWAPALGTQFLRQEHTVFPSPLPENKRYHSISSKFCLSGFHSASVGREDQGVGQQQKEVSQRKTNIVLLTGGSCIFIQMN